MSEMKRTPSKPSFESIDEAFNYCREKDQPVTVILDDTVQGYYGIYKLYPSGRADQIRRCICNQVDNHTVCPTHGMDQFVDWRAERKHRQLEAVPEMEELLHQFKVLIEQDHKTMCPNQQEYLSDCNPDDCYLRARWNSIQNVLAEIEGVK